MATFHTVHVDGVDRVIQLVKGGPDVVLARCTEAGGPLSGAQVPITEARAGIDEANATDGREGFAGARIRGAVVGRRRGASR